MTRTEPAPAAPPPPMAPAPEPLVAEPKPRAPHPWEANPDADPWSRVLSAAAPNRRMRVLLNDCSLVKVENDLVVVAVSDALLSAAQSSEKELCQLLASAWDKAVRLEFRGSSAAVSPTEQPEQAPPEAPLSPITDHPLVRQAMELFNAKLVGVQPRKTQP